MFSTDLTIQESIFQKVGPVSEKRPSRNISIYSGAKL